ncbi:MAG TPA: hypothetical protein VF611_16850 [Pyrinomonadaceae bacterium]|jgi:hypothetical protein
MLSLLLKKALPFTLTFVVGTALGGLTWLFGGSEKKAEAVLVTRTYDFKRKCGSRRRHLVAETRQLAILSKPEARLPLGAEPGQEGARRAVVRVTFGADGKVQDVRPLASWLHGRGESLVGVKATWEAVERAARQIGFTPETVDGVPVTVSRDVEIHFMRGE